MKRLVTFLGGHPFQLDDLLHMQAAFEECLSMLGKWGSVDGTPRLVMGCKVTGTIPSRTVSEGWVWWNNEFYFVPATTVGGSNPYIVLLPILQWLPPSPVIYANAIPRNVHRYGLMQVTSSPTTGNPAVAYLDGLVRWGTNPWHDVGTLGTAFTTNFTNLGSGYANVGFRRNATGAVELRGASDTTATPGINLIFALPVGYRPAHTIRRTASTNAASVFIDVFANGEVWVYPAPIGAGVATFLDGIQFDAALNS